ncbi:hypothetical protein Kpho01_40080 [Kitasatospora phosalacinea]|uniref:Uncharacterized protein n=1 Tax=Kitasatospora phosalacinea TaxID=2065 RepID=A0A9W6PJJ1_9ACTN|nr:hypothetical protein Kpho01_40080 [Kitasatospora phosalacinea]
MLKYGRSLAARYRRAGRDGANSMGKSPPGSVREVGGVPGAPAAAREHGSGPGRAGTRATGKGGVGSAPRSLRSPDWFRPKVLSSS